jgi:hypothetical protein
MAPWEVPLRRVVRPHSSGWRELVLQGEEVWARPRRADHFPRERARRVDRESAWRRAAEHCEVQRRDSAQARAVRELGKGEELEPALEGPVGPPSDSSKPGGAAPQSGSGADGKPSLRS